MKSIKNKEEFVFTAVILVFFTIFLLNAIGYNSIARLVPLVIAIPAVLLGALQLLLVITQGKMVAKSSENVIANFTEENVFGEGIPNVNARQPLEVWAWVVGLALAVSLLGFIIGSFLFLLAFLRFFSGKKWVVSSFIAVLVTASIYLLFVTWLKVQI